MILWELVTGVENVRLLTVSFKVYEFYTLITTLSSGVTTVFITLQPHFLPPHPYLTSLHLPKATEYSLKITICAFFCLFSIFFSKRQWASLFTKEKGKTFDAHLKKTILIFHHLQITTYYNKLEIKWNNAGNRNSSVAHLW